MTIVLNGIYIFLNFLNNNWTMICAIVVLALAIAKKAKEFFSKSQNEQLAIAKAQIKEIMLRLVTEAESDNYTWISAGAVKRSQVIDEIFAMYPILSRVSNQEEIIAWLDDTIDDALKTMRKIFEENESSKKAE